MRQDCRNGASASTTCPRLVMLFGSPGPNCLGTEPNPTSGPLPCSAPCPTRSSSTCPPAVPNVAAQAPANNLVHPPAPPLALDNQGATCTSMTQEERFHISNFAIFGALISIRSLLTEATHALMTLWELIDQNPSAAPSTSWGVCGK